MIIAGGMIGFYQGARLVKIGQMYTWVTMVSAVYLTCARRCSRPIPRLIASVRSDPDAHVIAANVLPAPAKTLPLPLCHRWSYSVVHAMKRQRMRAFASRASRLVVISPCIVLILAVM